MAGWFGRRKQNIKNIINPAGSAVEKEIGNVARGTGREVKNTYTGVKQSATAVGGTAKRPGSAITTQAEVTNQRLQDVKEIRNKKKQEKLRIQREKKEAELKQLESKYGGGLSGEQKRKADKLRRETKRLQQLEKMANPKAKRSALDIKVASRKDWLFGRNIEGISVAEQNKLKKEDPKLYDKYVKYKERAKRREQRNRIRKQKTSRIAELAKGKASSGTGTIKHYGGIAWRNKGKVVNEGIQATQKMGEATSRLGYALPGPVQVFTLAWQKMTNSLKALIIIVFALVLLFVPWGVFYYSGWAVGAGFMFLVSLIYWAFISLFNGLATVIVALINGIARILMSAVIGAVQWVTDFMLADSYWSEGHELMNKALIQFEQFAEVPELMKIIEPAWKPWMNNTIIHQLLFEIFKIDYPFTWISKPISDFYAGLDPTQSMVVGLSFVAIPIVLLIYIYYKNRHHFY